MIIQVKILPKASQNAIPMKTPLMPAITATLKSAAWGLVSKCWKLKL